jgi:hypothetical protein
MSLRALTDWQWRVLGYFLLVNSFYLLLLAATVQLRSHREGWRATYSNMATGAP